jgi:hypothetical protein
LSDALSSDALKRWRRSIAARVVSDKHGDGLHGSLQLELSTFAQRQSVKRHLHTLLQL